MCTCEQHTYTSSEHFHLEELRRNHGRDPFNQNSNRSDREKWSTSKGGPVFSKLFRLDRTDPLSFGPKFPEILVEWIAPHARPGQRKFSCPGRESNSRPSKSHHSRETNRKIMARILSYEPTFDRKILLRILDMFLPSKRFKIGRASCRERV